MTCIFGPCRRHILATSKLPADAEAEQCEASGPAAGESMKVAGSAEGPSLSADARPERGVALPGASALPPPGTVAGPQQPVIIVCISDDDSDGAGPSEVKPRSQRLPTTAARRPSTCCPIVICIDDSDDDEAAAVGPAPSARGEAGSSGRGPPPAGEAGAAAVAAASGVAPLASDGPEWLTDARAALHTLLQGVLAQLQKFDVVGREVSGVLWTPQEGRGGGEWSHCCR